MQIYKFGGASVKGAQEVRNVCEIVRTHTDRLVIVVSAMGKTTNALEEVVNALWNHQPDEAQTRFDNILRAHEAVAKELGVNCQLPTVNCQLSIVNYDELYDAIVSIGELLSSRILSAYLAQSGVANEWLSMPDLLITDDTYREAKVDNDEAARRIRQAVLNSSANVFVAQGFIGGTRDGHRTTLGREGSDYTAALMANFLDADSVTIWKDVPGILNADPRILDHTILSPELSYREAVELAYSGAQVIHPKSIRPVENKKIPLYVKPFGAPSEAGTIICETDRKVDVPVYIWRKNQILITMRAKDFAFVLEESLHEIFDIIHSHRLKVSLIQSSAVTISVCVDNTRFVQGAIEALQQHFNVSYNDHLSLLTIRGTTPQILEQAKQGRTIMLSQTTRRTARLVVKENE